MIQAELCTICGQQLHGGDLRGFCPTCLLKAALDPQTTATAGSDALRDSETYPPDRVDSVSSVPVGIDELRRLAGFPPDRWSAADGGGNGAGQDTGMTGSFTGADHAHPARFGFADYPSIPGYEIRGILGEGGMGVVYEALQSRANRIIALKMIRGDAHVRPEQLQRFRAEAQAVARLRHPNVVQIFEVGEVEGLPYFSLELLAGGTLKARLAEAPLPPRPAAELLVVLAGAVHAAHQAGIVHRDLKPANILFDLDDTPKIADFGLAKRLEVEDGQTITGQVMGTPSYMAPEQASGKNREVGPSADVYALGAILYEVLTGRPPFKGTSTSETLLMVLTQDPLPPSRLQPRLPRDLETICLKCLHKEPQKRYASAQTLADDLERFLERRPIKARPTPMPERAAKWVRRRPVAAGFIGLGIASFLGLTTGWAFYEHRQRIAEATQIRHERGLEDVGVRIVNQAREAASVYDLSQFELQLSTFRERINPEARLDGLKAMVKAELARIVTRLNDERSERGATWPTARPVPGTSISASCRARPSSWPPDSALRGTIESRG